MVAGADLRLIESQPWRDNRPSKALPCNNATGYDRLIVPGCPSRPRYSVGTASPFDSRLALAHQPAHSPQLRIALMRHTPAPRYKPDHTSTIPVVCSLYRQKPRRQHLCIVERLLDFVVSPVTFIRRPGKDCDPGRSYASASSHAVVAGAPANCLPSQDGCFTLRIHHNCGLYCHL